MGVSVDSSLLPVRLNLTKYREMYTSLRKEGTETVPLRTLDSIRDCLKFMTRGVEEFVVILVY